MKVLSLVLSFFIVAAMSQTAGAAEAAKEPLSAVVLINKLAETKSEKERNTIVEDLVKLGQAALPDLREGLAHRNWRVQWGSAISLGMIGDKSSAAALINLLKNGTDAGKRGAATALGILKEMSAVPHLIEALYGGNALAAVEALGFIGDPGTTPLVMRFMEETKDNDEKRVAAEALGRIKDPMAIPVLIDGIRSSSWQVQAPSRWALVSIGKPSVPALVEALKIEGGDAARLAAEALGELKEQSAVKSLIHTLGNHKDARARIGAAEALGLIGDPSAIAPLINAFEDKGEYTLEFIWKGVRTSAAEAVSRMPRDALPVLHKALDSAVGDRLEFTCMAIDKIGDKGSVEPLLDVIQRVDDENKMFPIRVLGNLADKRAVPVLIELLGSSSVKVRQETATALGSIADEAALPALQSLAAKDPDMGVKRISQRMIDKINFLNLR